MNKHIELLEEALLISDLVRKHESNLQWGECLETDAYDGEADKIKQQIDDIENKIKEYLKKEGSE